MHPKLSLLLLLFCILKIFTVLADEAGGEVPIGSDEGKLASPMKPQDMLPTWLKDFRNLVQNPPNLYQETQQTMGSNVPLKESTISIATSIQKSLEEYRQTQQGSRLPRDCDEAVREEKKSGVYRMELPASYMPAFHAYCLKTKDAVWMVIQRRIDGKINFNRDWNAYKKGFGDLSGEHWLGLDSIHDITVDRPHELLIVLTDQDNINVYAHYTNFMIGDEDSKYALRLLGRYSGNAKDSLSYHAGHEFSTRDVDNDSKIDGNCTDITPGGWWFGNCGESHLNGVYQKSEPKTTQGIQWNSWRGEKYSLKNVYMAIRPKRN